MLLQWLFDAYIAAIQYVSLAWQWTVHAIIEAATSLARGAKRLVFWLIKRETTDTDW